MNRRLLIADRGWMVEGNSVTALRLIMTITFGFFELSLISLIRRSRTAQKVSDYAFLSNTR